MSFKGSGACRRVLFDVAILARPAARLDLCERLRDGRDVFGRGAAAAAGDVHETGRGELLQEPRGVGGQFVEAGVAHRVRQARVRVARHVGVAQLREFGDIRAHERRAERAVQAERERLRVTQRIPERLDGLTRENAARGVGDGARDHDRQVLAGVLEQLVEREQRGLGVERVEDRLDEEQIAAAVHQRLGLLVVRAAQFLERHVARARIVDVGRDARGLRRRSDRARDEARLVGRRVLVARGAREFRRLHVHLDGEFAHAVVVLRHRGRAERVGFDDVRARGEILVVNLADDLRLREREQFVIALDVARIVLEALAAISGFVELVALDHRAHRAVENQDARSEQRGQRGAARVAGGRGSVRGGTRNGVGRLVHGSRAGVEPVGRGNPLL
ncbi:hypothetical protein PT2222_10327 [Paraburkholderia tropica]